MLTRKLWALRNQADDKGSGASDEAGGSNDNDSTGADANANGSTSLEDLIAENTALKKRLAEKDSTNEKLGSQLDELKAFRDTRLKAEGDFEQLLKDEQARLAELSPKAAAYEKLLEEKREENKARVAKLPEQQQAWVAPFAEQLDPLAFGKFLDEGAGILGKPKATDTNAGAA